MQQQRNIPFWKNAPFIRILLPLIAGIIVQWYIQFQLFFIIVCLGSFVVSFILFYNLSISLRYTLYWLQGIQLHLIIFCFAMLATFQKDVRNSADWYGNNFKAGAKIIVRINEPPVEKSKSFKADGIVEEVLNNEKSLHTSGKILLYFSKTDGSSNIHYGDRLLIAKYPEAIKNSGNPEAFNYERYAAFQQLYHNIYLKPGDYYVLQGIKKNKFDEFLFTTRTYIINCIQKYLPHDNKNVTGIAEALLIGYKEDLDKDLVQAYSNTGVVHIIAISGLHLGLIYVMLTWIFGIIPFIKRSKFLKVVFILTCLWVFSLLTGGSASVLRSAVMFTCIVIGKNYFKQASIYNSLATSAVLLLLYNPYYLWDVGFQLSYFAVYGIVWLQKPIYHLWYVKNKLLNKVWQMCSVTLAAQIITFPICIYYFHQFPNAFLITNLLAVPLSTIILFVEIFLILCSWIPMLALWIGHACYWLVWLMNAIIELCNKIPYSVIDRIYATPVTTLFLYAVVIGGCTSMLYKNKLAFKFSAAAFVVFTLLHTYAKIKLQHQQKIIIYNVAKYKAIDFVYKDKYVFVGDSILLQDGLLQNFHLKPGRISLQLKERADDFPQLTHDHNIWTFGNKTIIILDSAVAYKPLDHKLKVDILLISKNPSIDLKNITSTISPAVVVFDGANSLWKISQWKKQCEQLLLPCFSVSEKGAYVTDAN